MGYKYVDDIGRILTEQLDIVSVISSRVPLKRAGRNYKANCPFHQEKTPSFVVSPERQSYHCFGCGASGNAISFVMSYENLDFLSALESLAEKEGIDLTPYLNKEEFRRPKEELSGYYELNRRAARAYFEEFQKTPSAKEYLLSRGIAERTLRRFGIGYAPAGWDFLVNKLGKALPEDTAQKCGLFAFSEQGKMYDRFRERIIFPIFDVRKRVIGFGGRLMGEDPRAAKYLNSPDTPLFNKSFHLYGLHEAKNHLSPDRQILLVEGYMDVLGLHDKGVPQAVASLGTALTPEQGKLISRYAEEVVIIFDGDEAGQKATVRALEVFRTLPLRVIVVNLPPEDDPDSFVQREGAEGFREYLKQNAKASVEYIIDREAQKSDLQNMAGQQLFLSRVMPLIEQMDASEGRGLYIQKVADYIGVEPRVLTGDWKLRESVSAPRASARSENRKYTRHLLGILISEPSIALQMIATPYYQYLSDNWHAFISYLLEHKGYNIQSAIEIFTLEQVEFFEEASKQELSRADMTHWRTLLRYFAQQGVMQQLEELRESSQKSDAQYAEMDRLKKKLSELIRERGRDHGKRQDY